MYIFIDTNLYQQAVRSPSPSSKTFEDLNSYLRKRRKKTEEKPNLIITDQVWDEYYRAETNAITTTREKVAAEECIVNDVHALLLKKPPGKFKEAEVQLADLTRKIVTTFEAGKEKRLREFDKNVEKVKKVIVKLFDVATTLECDESAFRTAEIRAKRGMHPKPNKAGKDTEIEETSIGDAINWELLLRAPDNAGYVLITKDGDFLDKDGALHKTLQVEWDKKHPSARISVFRSVHEFLVSVKAVKKVKKKKTKKIGRKATGPSPVTTGGAQGSFGMFVSGAGDPTFTTSGTRFNQFSPHFISTTSAHPSLGLYTGEFNATQKKPTVCPFCGALRENLVTGMEWSGKTSYSCLNCNNTFEV